jgi:hypothetical protein
MEYTKSRNPDGSQNREYYTRYYRENRERIAELNKARYFRVRSDPKSLILIRKRATETTRKYRERHPDRVLVARRKQYVTRKIRALNLAGGVKCVRCGCDVLDYLEFNHIKGNGCKDWRENKGIAMMDRILTKKRDTDDLEVLCRVCNALEFLERKNDKHKGRFSIIWK